MYTVALTTTSNQSVTGDYNGANYYIPWDSAVTSQLDGVWSNSTDTFATFPDAGIPSGDLILQIKHVLKIPDGVTMARCDAGIVGASGTGATSGICKVQVPRTLSSTGSPPYVSNGGVGMAKIASTHGGGTIESAGWFGWTPVTPTVVDGNGAYVSGDFFCVRAGLTGQPNGYSINNNPGTFAVLTLI